MRKTRSDCTVGTFEKKHGLPPGTIRNKDGRDTWSDKKIGTIRKEAERGKWFDSNIWQRYQKKEYIRLREDLRICTNHGMKHDER